MFKAIAVEDSEMPDFVIYRPQDLIHAHARAGELPVPLLFAFAATAPCRCGLPL